MPAPVAIVVVTWNSRGEIKDCLRTALAEEPQELVVVDNGSQDGTAELIRSAFPSAHLICESQNTGFAAGCNTGIAATAAPFVLLLNADAQLQPGYVGSLVRALVATPRAASATGKLVYQADGVG